MSVSSRSSTPSSVTSDDLSSDRSGSSDVGVYSAPAFLSVESSNLSAVSPDLSPSNATSVDQKLSPAPVVAPKAGRLDFPPGFGTDNSAGSNLSKLESLVNNLLKNKTSENVDASVQEAQVTKSSPNDYSVRPSSDCPVKSEPQGSPQSWRLSPPSDAKPTLPLPVPTGLSPFTSQPPPHMPVPMRPGMPCPSTAPFPGYSFQPMLPFGYPLPMSPMHLPTCTPNPNATCIQVKSEHVTPPRGSKRETPLDLSNSCRKRKLNYDNVVLAKDCLKAMDQPLNLVVVKKERFSPVSDVSGPVSGLDPCQQALQIHIPQSVRSPAKPGATILSPKPSVLHRSQATSAFSPYNLPVTAPTTGSPSGHCHPSTLSSNHSNSDPSNREAKCSKDMFQYEHNVLQTEFLNATMKLDAGSSVHKLQQTYRCEVERVEADRTKMLGALVSLPEGSPEKKMADSIFDNQRLVLVRQFKLQLFQEKVKVGLDASVSDTTKPLMPPMPMPMMPFPMGMPHHHAMPPMNLMMPGTAPFHPTAAPQKMAQQTTAPHKSPQQTASSLLATSPDSSASMESSDYSGDSSCSPGDGEEGHSGHKRKFLNQHATSILSAWYDSHYDHPYPDEATVGCLATTAGITTNQVKKWMANKRVRSCNTLAFNGSIHPKKLAKLIQMKESGSAVSTPTPKSPPEVTTPWSEPPKYSAPSDMNMESPILQAPSSDGKRIKRLLNPAAVEFMNCWYGDHINYPYPTEEEKNQIAMNTGLSVAQVTCWFANKRNRSNNTRKISTKGLWNKAGGRKGQSGDVMVNGPMDGMPPMMPMMPGFHGNLPPMPFPCMPQVPGMKNGLGLPMMPFPWAPNGIPKFEMPSREGVTSLGNSMSPRKSPVSDRSASPQSDDEAVSPSNQIYSSAPIFPMPQSVPASS